MRGMHTTSTRITSADSTLYDHSAQQRAVMGATPPGDKLLRMGTRGAGCWGTQRLSVTNIRRDDTAGSLSQRITASHALVVSSVLPVGSQHPSSPYRPGKIGGETFEVARDSLGKRGFFTRALLLDQFPRASAPSARASPALTALAVTAAS
jgi:hypothetical protein